MTRSISAHATNIFMEKTFQFRMALFYSFFALGTLTTVTIFLNLKKSVLPKITDPARETQCVHRVSICKLLTTFLGTNWACLFDSIHTGGLIVIQLLD